MRALLLILCCTHAALAGPLLLPGDLKGAAPPKGAPPQILFSHAQAQIEGGVAKSTLTETLKGEGAFALLLPLSPSDEVKGCALGGVALKGRVLKPKAASALLTKLGKARQDTRLLSFVHQRLYVVDQLTLKGEAILKIDLEQPLSSQDGFSTYQGVMSAPQFAQGVIERARFTATIQGAAPIRAVFSDTHALTVKRPSPTRVEVSYTKAGLEEGADLRLSFVEDADPLGLRFLTHREAGAPGYFLLLGNPSGGGDEAQAPKKTLILAVDASGSMRGEKWEQALSAMSYILDHLGGEDRFNVITFGTEVQAFTPQPQPKTPQAIAAAKAHLDALIPVGRTNISEALRVALAGEPGDAPRVVIFLTDGTPTAGEQDPKAILKDLKAINTAQAQVFALGVGDDVNPQLLDRVAEDTGGRALYVSEEEALDTQIAALYDRLSHPALSEVKLDFGGASVSQIHPEALGALFQGEDLIALGRFEGEGVHSVTVRGMRGGAPRAFTLKAQLPKATDSRHQFIPALWAARRIGDLLAKIRLQGPEPKWIEEVVTLSHRYGIVTEYTRFIAEEEISAEEANRRASDLMGAARQRASGRWAVQQSVNEANLRGKLSNDNADNAYFDRRGVRTKAKSKIIGKRAFYKRGDRWVQSQDAKNKPAKRRVVKRFSPEYMELIKKDQAFSEAQQLDAPVTVFSGDELIEVR
ncbi:VWA domain-containing protein [Myxococcota bacterium]|nr:VWA domain-containing protein [Myxococcota bacterium]